MDGTGKALTFRDVIDLLESNPSFSTFFNDVLKRSGSSLGSRFEQFFWECPAVSAHTAGQLPYEHVTIRRDERSVEPASSRFFQDKLNRVPASALATCFSNLDGDAKLVVPCPHGRNDTHGNLPDFVRYASAVQQEGFWAKVGQSLNHTLRERGGRPVWLCTDGRSVPWLHVRLDSTPKYYKYHGYADSGAMGYGSVGGSHGGACARPRAQHQTTGGYQPRVGGRVPMRASGHPRGGRL